MEGRGCYELVVMGFIGSGKVDWLVLWGDRGYWLGCCLYVVRGIV